MYDPKFVEPMRRELTEFGVIEMRTAADVDAQLKASSGTNLVVVNSICGCAAGGARPAVKMALQSAKRPAKVTTVFAGQDLEATERARSYFVGYPPSSPSFALLKNGEVVDMIHRHQIEGQPAEAIAKSLSEMFERHC